jgi:hypothetical protein
MGLFDSFLGPGMWVKLGLDKQDFDKGMGQVKVSLVNWRNETNSSTLDLAKWGAAIGSCVAPILAVGYAVNALAQKYGGLAQQLKDLSYMTGLSNQKLQEFQWTAVLSGTSFDKVTFAIGNLNIKLAEAADRSSKAYQAFYDIGVNPEGKTPEQVIDAVALALSTEEDSTKRATVANELYGRGWREVLPFMQAYLNKKDEIANKPKFTDEDLKGFEDLKVSIDDATKSLEVYIGKTYTFLDHLMPSDITEESNALYFINEGIKDLQQTDKDMQHPTKTGKSLEELARDAANAAEKITNLRERIGDLYMKIAEDPAQITDLQFHLDDADKYLKMMMDMKRETTEYGGPGIAYERKLHPDEVDPVTGIKWSDHQYYLKFLDDVSRAQNADVIAADRLTAAKREQGKTIRELSGEQSNLAKLIAGTASDAIAADTKIIDSLTTRVTTAQTQYAILDQTELVHWTAVATMAQITYQAIVDYAAEAVNFAGSHPIIQKIVMLSKSGYDIDPSPLQTITAPALAAADFSKVVLTKTPETTPTETKTGGTAGTGGKSVSITLNQTNYGVKTDAQAVNKSLGTLAQLVGAGGR